MTDAMKESLVYNLKKSTTLMRTEPVHITTISLRQEPLKQHLEMRQRR